MNRRVLPGLAALLAASLLGLSWIPRDPDSERPWQAKATTFSPGPDGVKALYLLLSQLGLEVRRLRHPAYAELPASVVLWALGREPFGRVDRRDLLAFVERGGTLIAPPAAIDVILEAAGAGPCADEARPRRAINLVVAGDLRLELEAKPGLISSCREPDRVHSADDDGAPLVAEWRIGSGRAISFGLDELARNRNIGKAGNGAFLARLALELGREHVFDEFSTGFGEGSTVSLLLGVPYRWGLAQLGLGLALGAWAFVPRRRPAEPGSGPRRRRTLDHVEAVARLWQRAGDAGLPLSALLAGLNTEARARSGDAGDCPFVTRIERMRPDLAARARQIWQDAERLALTPSPPPEAVRRAVIDLRGLQWEISKAWAKPPAT